MELKWRLYFENVFISLSIDPGVLIRMSTCFHLKPFCLIRTSLVLMERDWRRCVYVVGRGYGKHSQNSDVKRSSDRAHAWNVSVSKCSSIFCLTSEFNTAFIRSFFYTFLLSIAEILAWIISQDSFVFFLFVISFIFPMSDCYNESRYLFFLFFF